MTQNPLTSKKVQELPPEVFAAALGRVVKEAIENDRNASILGALEDKHGQQTRTFKRKLTNGQYLAFALSLAEQLRTIPNLRGTRSWTKGPVWGTFTTPEGDFEYPLSVSALLENGSITPFECVLAIEHASEAGFASTGSSVTIVTGPHDGDAARQWLLAKISQTEKNHDLLRNRVVVVDVRANDSDRGGLAHSIVEAPTDTLDDVIVTDAVRAEIRRNIVDHVRSKDLLQQAGLGSNRGVLLWGPPGTGKTSIIRGVLNELSGEATVFLVSAKAMGENLGELYAEAERLSPSIVVLEDLDNVAKSRGSSLHTFLVALDGVLRDPSKLVVTIATTNDPASIDEAAKRPGRIDRFVEVALPDEKLRLDILLHYFEKLARNGIQNVLAPNALVELAANSAGASGALLREVVRRSLLLANARSGNGAVVNDNDLAEAALEIGYRVYAPNPGQYL